MKFLALCALLLAAMTARAATANLIYDTVVRVAQPTNLIFKNQIITNSTIDGVASSAIATNSAANKLNITNGTAVNLTGSLTNVTADGFPVRPFRLTHSGLVTTIGAGTLIDRQGNVIAVAGNTVTNIASITNYLVVTLSDLTVRSVRRALHGGAVVVGTVVCDVSGVTSIAQPDSFRLPSDPLYRFKTRLSAGQPQRVVVLGTSLMNYSHAATNVAFQNLLFSSTYSATGYNVTQVTNITQLKYSQGSTGPHLSAAMVGRTRGQMGASFAVDSQALGLVVGPGTIGYYSSSPPRIQDSPLATSSDLVIIDGYNYGYGLLTYIEAEMKKISAAGADVIILNTGPNTTTTDYRYDQGPYLRAMCDQHGWGFVDLNAFQRAQLDAGNTSGFIDGVHPSRTGNEFYAARILDLLTTYKREPATPSRNRFSTVSRYELGTSLEAYAPEEFDVLANAARTTGATDQATLGSSSASTINPMILFGGKTSSTAITVLETNEWSIYGHPLARAWDLLVEVDPTEAVDIDIMRESGATLIKTFTQTFSSAAYGKQMVALELFTPAEVVSYTSDLSSGWEGYTNNPFANTQFRLLNQGAKDLRIIAAVAHTVRHSDVNHREWMRGPQGNWLEEAAAWATGGTYRSLGNDTIGANLHLNYRGRGICVVLQRSPAGGQIYLNHDGVVTVVDTYSASSLSYKYCLAAPDVESASGRWDVEPRDHNITVTLGLAGSGGAGAATQRKLTVVAAYIIQ